jgi:hypothetical protein
MIDWISLAKARSVKSTVAGTAKTSENPISAVLAVPPEGKSRNSARSFHDHDTSEEPGPYREARYTTSVAPVRSPSADPHDQLVAKLMAEDGLTLQEAQAIAANAVLSGAPSEWIKNIARLDELISVYCELSKTSAATILEARRAQPLSSIQESLSWFSGEIRRLQKGGS